MSLPARTQIAIVGGGFAGAATAYFLTRAGVRDVVVLERETVCGFHASGRNAALGRQLTEDERFTDLAIRGAAFLREPPVDFSAQPLLSRSGSILIASTPATLATLRDRARTRALPAEALRAEAVVERWPLLAGTPLVGGVLFPTDGVIDVHALLQGYLAGARRGGARVETGCEVLGFRPGGAGVSVETSRGEVEARCVVIAAGAWAEPLGRRAGVRDAAFDPVRRHLFVTEPMAALDPTAPFAWHLDEEFYLRPESGACLLTGGDQTTLAPCDPAPQPAAVAELARKLSRVAPRLAEYGIARTWACLRTFTVADRRPRIGWDAAVPWLFWTAGLGGHGATGSAAIGEESAAAITARLA